MEKLGIVPVLSKDEVRIRAQKGIVTYFSKKNYILFSKNGTTRMVKNYICGKTKGFESFIAIFS
jgi:hypothetical protein